MKYIYKNIKSFFIEEKLIFNLVIICIFFSGIIFNFSFGIYHEFKRLSYEDIYGTKELCISFNGLWNDNITKGEMMKVISLLDEDITNDIDYIFIVGYFPGDDIMVENKFEFHFAIRDGRITYVKDVYNNIVQLGFWVSGEYFTKSQYENGELVALCGGIYDPYYGFDESYKYGDKDGYVYIDGKKYRCIGYQRATYTPWIPITTVSDDFNIEYIAFVTYETMTKKEYVTITSAIKEQFGDAADIPDYPIPDSDDTKLYNSIIIICILIAVISSVVYAVLYQYIIYQRKRNLNIYRICGFTLKNARKLYMTECMAIASVCYIISVIFFHAIILPQLEKIYYFIGESYSLSSYLQLGIIYFVIVYIILKIMMVTNLRNDIVKEL